MKLTPDMGGLGAHQLLLSVFIFAAFSVTAHAQDNTQNLAVELPVSKLGERTELQAGVPCDALLSSINGWINENLPTLTTSSITAGRAVNVTGSMTNGLVGSLRFEVYDYATSQKEWTSEPVSVNGTVIPNAYQVPIIFPKAGAEKLIFGCFVDPIVLGAAYTGVGQRVFPDFPNSFSVAGAPGGGGGCAAFGPTKWDPTLPSMLALAIAGLWLRNRSRRR
jgi:hypothetical protein